MKLCVVGGGTAGWITLSYLAATTDLELTIIHSNEIDIIGVGESTTPSVRYVADAIGINESIWMRDAKATYKLGVDFLDWIRPGSRWLHSFDDQFPEQAWQNPLGQNGKQRYRRKLTSIEYFLKMRERDPKTWDINKFNNSHGMQQYLCDNNISPYGADGRSNIGDIWGQAYHINAYEFGQSLRKHVAKERYTEIIATVDNVEYGEEGVKSLHLKDGRTITADIFFDCTGFHRLLNQGLTKYKIYEDLVADRAIFGSVKGLQSYKSATEAIAQDAGWIWVIPTWGQIGSGHVYCSSFMDEQTAIDTIVDFWKKRGYEYEMHRSIKFRGGRLEDIAIKNVISNGLGQSFIEPLEATSVMITCITAIEFATQYKKGYEWNKHCADVLNREMISVLEHTKDFVRYHYELTDRDYNDFWRTVRRPESVQEVSDIIDRRVKKDTLINGYNWASMLVGYDKPYLNPTANISEKQLEEYVYYIDMLENHYKWLNRNNISTEQWLQRINSQ